MIPPKRSNLPRTSASSPSNKAETGSDPARLASSSNSSSRSRPLPHQKKAESRKRKAYVSSPAVDDSDDTEFEKPFVQSRTSGYEPLLSTPEPPNQPNVAGGSTSYEAPVQPDVVKSGDVANSVRRPKPIRSVYPEKCMNCN